jgi:hypothetical protein
VVIAEFVLSYIFTINTVWDVQTPEATKKGSFFKKEHASCKKSRIVIKAKMEDARKRIIEGNSSRAF